MPFGIMISFLGAFQAECYHYLFDAALKLHQLGIDYSSPGHGPVNSPSSFESKNKHLSSGLANGGHVPDPSRVSLMYSFCFSKTLVIW